MQAVLVYTLMMVMFLNTYIIWLQDLFCCLKHLQNAKKKKKKSI